MTPITEAVILAGGLGERLRPLTKIIPKPLLPIGESSVLEILISNMAAAGIRRIYLAVNYRFEMFSAYLGDGTRYGVDIKYSKEEIPLGTAGPLKLLENELDETFLVTNGDILTNLDYRRFFAYREEVSADFLLATKDFRTPLSYGVVMTDGATVSGIEEKPVRVNRINAGIYMVRRELLRHIPSERAYSMNTFIQDSVIGGGRVCHYLLEDVYWLDIGHMADYERAQSMASTGELLG